MSLRWQVLGAALLSFTLVNFSPATASAQPAAVSAPGLKLFPDSQLLTRDRISVEVIGSGPDVVLIPGLASTRETFRHTAERLKERYRLHLIQVAGFGGEPARANASGPVLVPTAEAVDAYLVEAKLGKATIIGHSMGGTTALYLAQRHPDHVGRVLLVDALPFFGILMGGPAATSATIKPMADGMRTQMIAADATTYNANSRAMVQSMVTAAGDVDRIAAWGAASSHPVVAQAMADDMTLDLRPDLAKVKAPITLLYPFDPSTGATQAMFDGMYHSQYAPAPTAKLIRIDGSRHFIMYDQPDKFDAEVDRFLAG